MISESRLIRQLALFLQTSTEVPLGSTEVGPGDERIVEATRKMILPMLLDQGPAEVRQHDLGDVAVRFGPKGDDGMLLMTYVVSQHANLMDPGTNGKVMSGAPYGMAGKVVVGQGATQNKGPMAAAFEAIRNLGERLAKPVWLAVNTEGSSSHGGSRRIIEDLDVRAGAGIVMIGTDLQVSLGNRGRTDVVVEIKGSSSHSSQPWLGQNPIESLPAVLEALRDLRLPRPDPLLGEISLTPYLIECDPVAPHTSPETVSIHLDRRIGRDETPAGVVNQIRDALGSAMVPASVQVLTGPQMLPAFVPDDSPVVEMLRSAGRAAGHTVDPFYSMNAFDAGFPCSIGIPTVMFGPGKRSFAGPGLTGEDAVSIEDCVTAAEILARVILKWCG